MSIDPLTRWREFNEKPDFAGLLSFASQPYTEDEEDLIDADIAVIGAPMDDLVSDRPGCRLGPRAIRAASSPAGPHLEVGIDPLEVLKVLDFGDAAVVPGDPRRSHASIEQIVAAALDAGTMPIVLGGDHSVTEPVLRAIHEAHGPVGLVHFDAHTDTATHVFGATLSHGTWMRAAIEAGTVEPRRYVQLGLRGYWPPDEVLAWQRQRGVTWYLMSDIRARGLLDVLSELVEQIGKGPVFLSIDIDVVDPAYAPGTGTPEPGGLRPEELLLAARSVAGSLQLVGADLVEVAPTAVGSADITAVLAERVIREVLVGVATRRSPEWRESDVASDTAGAGQSL
jgi:agmatinase